MYRKQDIKMWIEYKYNNNVFKQLPLLVYLYVKDNPDELLKFLSKEIVMDDLLGYIYENTKEIIHKPIIEIVCEYVNNVCKTT